MDRQKAADSTGQVYGGPETGFESPEPFGLFPSK
jgi:hypothetical protein